jgi:hypothetical protein
MTLARGEVINSLEDKSLRMAVNADQFKKKAGETKRHFCFQHYRNILIMVGIVAVCAPLNSIFLCIGSRFDCLTLSCFFVWLFLQVVGVVLYLIFRPKSS